MPADAKTPDGFSLRRWSRRKLEAARESAQAAKESPVAPIPARDENVPASVTPVMPAVPGPAAESVLPPVESLTIDSDFTVFLQPKVDESLKRQALKKLFADPRFNVMDGLDVYIDDYTKSDPIPPDVLERLVKAHFSWSPPVAPGEVLQEPSTEPSIEVAHPAPESTAEPAAGSVPDATKDPSGASDTPDPAPSR